jgi:hypothetical protein
MWPRNIWIKRRNERINLQENQWKVREALNLRIRKFTNILEWYPTGRRRKGRPSKFMDAGSYNRYERKGITNFELVDREEWRRKNKTLGTEKCANIKTLYTNKRKIYVY